jgi:hypothetical protein
MCRDTSSTSSGRLTSDCIISSSHSSVSSSGSGALLFHSQHSLRESYFFLFSLGSTLRYDRGIEGWQCIFDIKLKIQLKGVDQVEVNRRQHTSRPGFHSPGDGLDSRTKIIGVFFHQIESLAIDPKERRSLNVTLSLTELTDCTHRSHKHSKPSLKCNNLCDLSA